MNLAENFQQHINGKKLFPTNAKLFIAVSGGIDSVVLCHLCAKAGYNFTILHCNFMLRGNTSNADELFVKELANNLQVPVQTIQFDTIGYAQQNKVSTQVAARELRYNWFNEVMDKGTDKSIKNYLLTAHHKDDDVETMLMNFFKGTGIAGIKGIPQQQGRVVRPLLFATKKELTDYAEQHQLTWVEDASNSETKYTRNYFRNIILPAVKEKYPAVEDNLYDNVQRFKEAEILYKQAVEIHKKKLLKHKGEEVHIPVLLLQSIEPLNTILFEIVKPYNFTAAQTNDIVSLLKASTGKYVQSSSHRVLRNRNWLIISPIQAGDNDVHIVIDNDGEYAFAQKTLTITKQIAKVDVNRTDKSIAYVNGNALQFPLLLRKWKQGDYFYPLGMRKKKKLARFFIDQKIANTEKEKIWVLEMNKQIVWVVGYRIDDRFKVTDNTDTLVCLEVK